MGTEDDYPDIEIPDRDSRRLNSDTSYETSMSSSSGQGFVPQGKGLLGCMFVFFIFSGGFIGSFFALDSLEEPVPQNYAAQIKLYPGITNDNCESYKACGIEGVVTIKPHKDEEDGMQVLKATLQGVVTDIGKVAIHMASEEPDCDDTRNIGDEYFYQLRTEIKGWSASGRAMDNIEAYLKIDHLIADKTTMRFHYLNGNWGVINPRIHIDTTCNTTSFGNEFVSFHDPEFNNGNLSGVVSISESGGEPHLSYDFLRIKTLEHKFELKQVKVYESSSCDSVYASSQTFYSVGSNPWTGTGDQDMTQNYDSLLGEWKGDFPLPKAQFGYDVKDYRGHAVGLIDKYGRLRGCSVVPPSPFDSLSIPVKETVQLENAYEGYTDPMQSVRGNVAVIWNGTEAIGCGVIPGSPYVSQAFEYKELEDYDGGRRVSMEEQIQTGHKFADFLKKIAVITDSDGVKVGCGVLM